MQDTRMSDTELQGLKIFTSSVSLT